MMKSDPPLLGLRRFLTSVEYCQFSNVSGPMKMREPHTPVVWNRNFCAARRLAVGVEVVRDDQDGETWALLAVGTPYLTSTYWLALSAIWARRVPLAACQRIHSVRVSKRIWI